MNELEHVIDAVNKGCFGKRGGQFKTTRCWHPMRVWFIFRQGAFLFGFLQRPHQAPNSFLPPSAFVHPPALSPCPVNRTTLQFNPNTPPSLHPSDLFTHSSTSQHPHATTRSSNRSPHHSTNPPGPHLHSPQPPRFLDANRASTRPQHSQWLYVSLAPTSSLPIQPIPPSICTQMAYINYNCPRAISVERLHGQVFELFSFRCAFASRLGPRLSPIPILSLVQTFLDPFSHHIPFRALPPSTHTPTHSPLTCTPVLSTRKCPTKNSPC